MSYPHEESNTRHGGGNGGLECAVDARRLFTEIEARLRADSATPLVNAARSASREAWPSFRYRNLSPEVRDHFREVLPLRREA